MRRIYELDAIRGIAAMVVAFHHLLAIYAGRGIPLLPALAVDTFFALSGFVMARTYEPRLAAGALTTLGFLIIRARRLFPSLAIGTTIGLAWLTLTGHNGLGAAYGMALAFLPAFWLAKAFPFNVPAWSLFLEIIANALHGAVFAHRSSRSLAFMLCGLALLAAALLAGDLGQWQNGTLAIVSCLPRELVFYLAGILAFRRYGDRWFSFNRNRVAEWLGALSYPLYATHAPVIHIAAMLRLPAPAAIAAAMLVAVMLALTVERLRLRRRGRGLAPQPRFRPAH